MSILKRLFSCKHPIDSISPIGQVEVTKINSCHFINRLTLLCERCREKMVREWVSITPEMAEHIREHNLDMEKAIMFGSSIKDPND